MGEHFDRQNLFALAQIPTVAHDGEGEIQFHRLATGACLSGDCNFIDFTTMPPGTTIGAHTHASSEEEFYLVLSGTGRMRKGREWFSVAAGDFVRNPPGGSHELVNSGETDLQLFVFELNVQ